MKYLYIHLRPQSFNICIYLLQRLGMKYILVFHSNSTINMNWRVELCTSTITVFHPLRPWLCFYKDNWNTILHCRFWKNWLLNASYMVMADTIRYTCTEQDSFQSRLFFLLKENRLINYWVTECSIWVVCYCI